MRILGVDPGSRLTGYGCVDLVGNQVQYVASGTFKLLAPGKTAQDDQDQETMPARLLTLHEALGGVIQRLRPQVLVVEKVFFAKNAMSALKLGQARGVVLLSAAAHSLKLAEYSPTEVKQSIAGSGRADKVDVARALQLLFGPKDFESWDASDGLALAVCHAHRSVQNILARSLAGASSLRSGSKRRPTIAESLGFGGAYGGRFDSERKVKRR
ncbi:MAG: crossover junction endodeoxyribonuclease RuvC [Bacteriovoracia bacterium]